MKKSSKRACLDGLVTDCQMDCRSFACLHQRVHRGLGRLVADEQERGFLRVKYLEYHLEYGLQEGFARAFSRQMSWHHMLTAGYPRWPSRKARTASRTWCRPRRARRALGSATNVWIRVAFRDRAGHLWWFATCRAFVHHLGESVPKTWFMGVLLPELWGP